jgi:hypothetical protein
MAHFLRLFGQNLLIASAIGLGLAAFSFILIGLVHLIGLLGVPIAIVLLMAVVATIFDISMGR